MASTLKTIVGMSFNLVIEEVNERDHEGRILLYVASVYVQLRGRSRLHLVRRSRVPGAAILLEREAQLGRIDVGNLFDVLRIDIPAA